MLGLKKTGSSPVKRTSWCFVEWITEFSIHYSQIQTRFLLVQIHSGNEWKLFYDYQLVAFSMACTDKLNGVCAGWNIGKIYLHDTSSYLKIFNEFSGS